MNTTGAEIQLLCDCCPTLFYGGRGADSIRAKPKLVLAHVVEKHHAFVCFMSADALDADLIDAAAAPDIVMAGGFLSSLAARGRPSSRFRRTGHHNCSYVAIFVGCSRQGPLDVATAPDYVIAGGMESMFRRRAHVLRRHTKKHTETWVSCSSMRTNTQKPNRYAVSCSSDEKNKASFKFFLRTA